MVIVGYLLFMTCAGACVLCAEGAEVKEEATDNGTATTAGGEGEQAVSGEDKEKATKGAEGGKKEGGKRRSREVSRERREHRRSAGSSHYSHQSHSPSSHRRGPRPHASPSRRPGVLTFAQIRVSVDTCDVEAVQCGMYKMCTG